MLWSGSTKLVTFVCGQLYNNFSVNPFYGVAQSPGSSHPPNLSTLTVNFLHSPFPHTWQSMLHLQSAITTHEPPSVSFRRFTVLPQQQLNKHSTFYKHCTASSHMYWDAHFNCEAPSCVYSFHRAAFSLWCALEISWEILCILKRFHLRKNDYGNVVQFRI